MVKCALCVALGLLGALLPAVAQQPHHSTKREPVAFRWRIQCPFVAESL